MQNNLAKEIETLTTPTPTIKVSQEWDPNIVNKKGVARPEPKLEHVKKED